MYGQTQCQRSPCRNHAYYRLGTQLVCGVHSRNKPDRVELPKMSAAAKLLQSQQLRATESQQIEAARQANVAQGQPGQVIVSQLAMRRHPESHVGYLKVFPNFKHQNRTDGYGCAALSPMSLGSVVHGQPGLNPALNLENFHQGSKCSNRKQMLKVDPVMCIGSTGHAFMPMQSPIGINSR